MCIQTHIDENQCRVNLSGMRTVKSRMCGRRTVMLRSGIAVILALSSLPGQCDVNGVVTATFENYVFHDSSGYTGTWLGRVPVTDPLSGITLSCPGGSLGVFPYNSSDPTAPSLYHGFNAVLSEGSTFLGWTYDFSRSEEHTSELQSPCNLVC